MAAMLGQATVLSDVERRQVSCEDRGREGEGERGKGNGKRGEFKVLNSISQAVTCTFVYKIVLIQLWPLSVCTGDRLQ